MQRTFVCKKKSRVQKWGGCVFGVTLPSKDNEAAVAAEQGYYENFVCAKREMAVVGSYDVRSIPQGQTWLHFTILHDAGRFNDPSVVTALEQSCSQCPFFIAKVAIQNSDV